eukprot:scaffold6338_cov136-Skeletonema_dohrnii-CCMP3373.AAC.2
MGPRAAGVGDEESSKKSEADGMDRLLSTTRNIHQGENKFQFFEQRQGGENKICHLSANCYFKAPMPAFATSVAR